VPGGGEQRKLLEPEQALLVGAGPALEAEEVGVDPHLVEPVGPDEVLAAEVDGLDKREGEGGAGVEGVEGEEPQALWGRGGGVGMVG
jgi:hypothetical protein